MAKFWIGVVTGIGLVLVGTAFLLYLAVRLQGKPPEIGRNSVLVLRLEGDIPEKAPLELPGILGGSHAPVTVSGVWMSLRKAAADSRIRAVVLEPEGVSAGWGKLAELRADLERFRKSGKPVFAYLRQPGTRDYYAALAADRIFLGPQEPLMLKGLRAETMYFKKTLDKIGVSVEVEHAGKYKDFGDMFTRTDMGPETREVLGSVVDGIYGDITERIAAARRKSPDEVRAIMDRGPFTAAQALEAGLVDELRFEDQMWGELQGRLGGGDVKKVSLGAYAAAAPEAGSFTGRSRVALVVAQGDIVRGDPTDDGSGETNITAYGFGKVLNSLAADSTLKAVVVRIDSPGGEVTASDELWRQMNLLSKKKPVVISMSDTAASGGYYMAMTGDPIVAYPGTLTGSIGVVFGKPNLHGLYDKLGVSKDAIQRGKHADIDSDYTPLSPEERAILRDGIDASYRDFVTKVATARHRSFAEIEPAAQGRVWLGSQAVQQRLVDQMGGLDEAISLAKQKAGIPAGENVTVDVYPRPASILEVLMKRSSTQSALDAELAHVFGRMPYRAWMKGGLLRVMPYWVEVR